MSALSNNIKYLRVKSNLTQKELASKININHSVLSRLENGERPLKTIELLSLADFFNVSTDYILNRSTQSNFKENKKIKLEILEDEFPEGISLLYKANKALSPDQKAMMLRMIEAAFFKESDK